MISNKDIKSRRLTQQMLRLMAVVVILLMAAPMVPAQVIPGAVLDQTKVQTIPQEQNTALDMNGAQKELIPRAGAYPSLINNTTINAATQYNWQRKIVRTNNGTLHDVHESNGRIWTAKSTDNGKTWTNLTDISNNTNGCNSPAIATNGTAVFIVLRCGNDLRFRRSVDLGVSWFPDLSQQALRFYQAGGQTPNAQPASIAASGQWVYVVNWQFNWGGTWNDEIYIWRSNNLGTSGWTAWAGRTRVNNNDGFDDRSPSVSASGNSVYVTYTGLTGGNEVYFTRSDDNGQNWFATPTRLTNNAIPDQNPSIANNGTNVSIAWEQQQGGNNWEIMMVNSTNNGAAFGAALNMSNTTTDSRYPSVIRSINSTYVVWQDLKDHTTGDIFYSKYEANTISQAIDLTNDNQTNVNPNAVCNVTNKRIEYSWSANTPDPNKVLFSNFYVWPNKAPTMAWTGEANYVADGLNPEGATTAYNYVYRVSYTDADNDPPMAGYPEVWVDRNLDGNYVGISELYSMSAVNAADTTYSDGKLYTFTTKFTAIGDYTYTFRAYDDKNYGATGAPTSVMVGPKITKVNGPPILTWTGDFGYTNGAVSPSKAEIGDTFTYMVRYIDNWNETPAAGSPVLRIDMDNDGVYNGTADKSYAMTPVSGGTTYNAPGQLFFYNLTFSAAGTYGYEIYAENILSIPANLLHGLGPKVLPKGAIPLLTFTGEPGYTTRGVDPDHGSKYTDFKFRINYSQGDNLAPSSGTVNIGIDRNGNNTFEASEYVAMTAVNASDTNYTNGKFYTYNTTLPVPAWLSKCYKYIFSAKDTANVSAEGPGTALGTVCVDSTNTPPQLSWTLEDNYTAGGLAPTIGTTNLTDFIYRVKYKDDDGDSPSGFYPMVGIDKNLDGTIDGFEYFAMQAANPNDQIYSDGKMYTYTTKFDAKGEYKYTFVAKDKTDFAIGTPTNIFNGPSITTEFIKTYGPALAWVGAIGYEDDGVAPNVGTVMNTFVFKVLYTDADNDLPAAGYPKVWIDMDGDNIYNGTNDKSYTLTGENASVVSVKTGKVYTASVIFENKGEYKYTFEAQSSRANETPVAMGSLLGSLTVARGNAVPVLSWIGGTGVFKDRGVDPATGEPDVTVFKYQMAYTDADNDPPATGYPKIYIDMNGDGIFNEVSELFTMTAVAAGNDYHNKAYQYTNVKFAVEGTMKYKFVASDNLGAKAINLTGAGPEVAKPIINLKPSLVFPSDALYKYDGLDPIKGTKKTKFVFKVIYMDPEGDTPQANLPQLWIDVDHDGLLTTATDKKAMQADNQGDFIAGRTYKLELTLDPGYTYKYAFFVNNTANQTAYLGEFNGPVVTKDVKKTPSGMGDTFWIILLVIALVIALILGLVIGRAKAKKAERALVEAEPEERQAKDVDPEPEQDPQDAPEDEEVDQ